MAETKVYEYDNIVRPVCPNKYGKEPTTGLSDLVILIVEPYLLFDELLAVAYNHCS
jgi:hypothetical protein